MNLYIFIYLLLYRRDQRTSICSSVHLSRVALLTLLMCVPRLRWMPAHCCLFVCLFVCFPQNAPAIRMREAMGGPGAKEKALRTYVDAKEDTNGPGSPFRAYMGKKEC